MFTSILDSMRLSSATSRLSFATRLVTKLSSACADGAPAPPVVAGLKGFYRGLSATVVSDVWGIGMGFVFYDLANSAFTKLTGRKRRASEKGLVGGTTACLSMTVAMPLEIVMTRMRVQGLPGYPVVYKSALDCVAKGWGNFGHFKESLFRNASSPW